ncbi:MAG TPA: ABC transporter permease [Symbiobacteriaceae bacterium]|jgi:ABC-2 type transport system permease protein
MSLVRLWAVMRKEFIQVLRDKTTLRIIIIMPLLMMFMFGYVVSTDVKSVATAVALQDTGGPARELLAKFEQTGYYTVTQYVSSAAEVGQLIQSGAVKVGVVIPPDYSEKIGKGQTAQVQVLIDGSDPIIARTALSTAELLGQISGSEILTQKLQRASGGGLPVQTPIEVRGRVWYNPNLDSVKFNLPGLVGAILQNLTIALVAGAMVRERERGTLEQLIVTPVRSAELMIGKMAPYVVISVVDVVMVLVVAIMLFGMRIEGSIFVLALNTFIFLMSSLGLGMLISTVATNQVQANQLSQMILLPSILLSGYMFPREAMPHALQIAGLAIPLTYFLQVLRGVILKGNGLADLWSQEVAMTVYSIAILGLGVWRLRKKLD